MQKNGSLFHHVCLSVSLSTWNTAFSTGQILVKIYIDDFFIKISEPEVWLKLDKHEAYTTVFTMETDCVLSDVQSEDKHLMI
jgi:hypothetical protein